MRRTRPGAAVETSAPEAAIGVELAERSALASRARFATMIRNLRIENYRALRRVELTLEPLTVLVGPNGSGKSSLLRALTGGGIAPTDCWRFDPSNTVAIETVSDAGITRRGGPSSLVLAGRTQGSAQSAAQLVELDLKLLRAANNVNTAIQVDSSGSNLPNVFASLGRSEEEKTARLFASLIPQFSDVNVKPTTPGCHGFFFTDRWSPSIEYRPEQVSDGTMLVLAYVTILHQRSAPDLLAIEEPERGLHPYLLRELVTLLRRMSAGELGTKPTQVVLATHSAELLNFVDPREVRFMDRSGEDGSVVVHAAPIDDPDWRKSVEAFDGSLGGMWLSGGLGGVPGS